MSNYNLNNGFLQQEIQAFSAKIFLFGGEGKGGTPPFPSRKRKKIPENIEYQMDKLIIQVNSAFGYDFEKIGSISSKISLDSEGNEPKTQVYTLFHETHFLFSPFDSVLSWCWRRALFHSKGLQLAPHPKPHRKTYLNWG